MSRTRTGILWCTRPARGRRRNGWAFPTAVDRELRLLTAGRSVLQIFGGLATWGTRLDCDPETRPHVIGDAWIPPFRRDAFDVVILDPPYRGINQQERHALTRAAAFVARDWLIWFHPIWIPADRHLQLDRAWLVRVGDSCAARCLQVFRIVEPKPTPATTFERGPALKYNRWAGGQMGLGLERPAAGLEAKVE